MITPKQEPGEGVVQLELKPPTTVSSLVQYKDSFRKISPQLPGKVTSIGYCKNRGDRLDFANRVPLSSFEDFSSLTAASNKTSIEQHLQRHCIQDPLYTAFSNDVDSTSLTTTTVSDTRTGRYSSSTSNDILSDDRLKEGFHQRAEQEHLSESNEEEDDNDVTSFAFETKHHKTHETEQFCTNTSSSFPERGVFSTLQNKNKEQTSMTTKRKEVRGKQDTAKCGKGFHQKFSAQKEYCVKRNCCQTKEDKCLHFWKQHPCRQETDDESKDAFFQHPCPSFVNDELKMRGSTTRVSGIEHQQYPVMQHPLLESNCLERGSIMMNTLKTPKQETRIPSYSLHPIEFHSRRVSLEPASLMTDDESFNDSSQSAARFSQEPLLSSSASTLVLNPEYSLPANCSASSSFSQECHYHHHRHQSSCLTDDHQYARETHHSFPHRKLANNIVNLNYHFYPSMTSQSMDRREEDDPLSQSRLISHSLKKGLLMRSPVKERSSTDSRGLESIESNQDCQDLPSPGFLAAHDLLKSPSKSPKEKDVDGNSIEMEWDDYDQTQVKDELEDVFE